MLCVFRPDASVPLRLARNVLVPFGPLIAVIVLGNTVLAESVALLLLKLAMAWFFCSLVLVPALLFRAESSPGSSSDRDGDGGGGPHEPPPRDPSPARIPLLDAEQSTDRVRDHGRRRRGWPGRRTAREPERAPSPKAHG
jgi:hypothetical protein